MITAELEPQLPELVPALMHRFASAEGYFLHSDVRPCLEALNRRGITIGAVTNSDPRVEDVLRSLGVCPELIRPEAIVTSWDVGVGKPHGAIWREAVDRERKRRNIEGLAGPVLQEAEVLHVGDNLQE